jgi:hypothetical protein
MEKIEFEKNFNIEIHEIWNPTLQLRWNRKVIRETYLNILEQLWISNTGNEEWRDIPQVGVGV